MVSEDELLIGHRGIWRVDLTDGTAELVGEGAPLDIYVSSSGRTIAWTECGDAGLNCDARIAVDGVILHRIPQFIVHAATDTYMLGYEFTDNETSGEWSVYDMRSQEVRRSEGPRNWAWDGYAISESEFLVTESGGGRGPRLVIYDGASMERRLVRNLELQDHKHLQYFNRSDRWAVMAAPEFIRYLGQDWSVQVIDLETGEVAAEVVLGDW